MTVNYNALRTMKGMAVGTIIPWSGQISGTGGIPKGWLPCVGGRTYRISEYPDLYEVIGNRYGGSQADGNFTLPAITGRSLTDYHPSHATELGYTGNFSTFLGTNNDIANQNIVTQSSNIDLFVTFNNANATTLRATATGHNINQSSYADSFGFVERRLGDAHLASHTHAAVLDSVKPRNMRQEDCQGNELTNGVPIFQCPGFCSDECKDYEYWRSSNADSSEDDFCVPTYDGGAHVGAGRVPYGTNGYRMERIDTPIRNYLLQSDDTVLYNVNGTGCRNTNECGNNFQGIYGTTLSTNIANFQNGSMSGHTHIDVQYTINTGNVATKQVVSINNISTEITPINTDVTEVMTIEANVSTPSIQMMYIIKAY